MMFHERFASKTNKACFVKIIIVICFPCKETVFEIKSVIFEIILVYLENPHSASGFGENPIFPPAPLPPKTQESVSFILTSPLSDGWRFQLLFFNPQVLVSI